MAAPAPFQPSLAELGTPLFEVTFCVVDLETTGGSPRDSRITEVGAVKLRGGEVVGEFQTLVDPGVSIPPAISALTGITNGLVAGYPPIEAVLPTFLEFASGTALVAHNARFDTGFLDAALARLDYPRLANPVVCTAALARRLLRDEVRDCKLATLAAHLRARTVPVHRALEDARATVDVLHALLERAGRFGVVTLDDLVAFSRTRNAPLFSRRRGLAEHLPSAPGVYAFRSRSGETLYVGKATDLRARVRSYFGGDRRRRIEDLLRETEAVEHLVCPTPIEAEARELRLIRAQRPRYNRRSKNAPRPAYVVLTAERYPRLSIVRRPPGPDTPHLGPLRSRRAAETVVDALESVTPLRRCRERIGPRTQLPACALAGMGRCPAPCEQRVDPERYAALVAPAQRCLAGDAADVLDALAARMGSLAGQGRFEEAVGVRERAAALVAALSAQRRRTWLLAAGILLAAKPVRGGWEVVRVVDGALAGSARGAGPPEALAAGLTSGTSAGTHADSTPAEGWAAAAWADGAAAPACSEELDLVAGWLGRPGVVVLHASGALAAPLAGGRSLAAHAARLRHARRDVGRADSELAAKRLRRAG